MSYKNALEILYSTYNHPKWLMPDPLAIVLGYNEPSDIELTGLIASALALGNASLIMKAVEAVLLPFGEHPSISIQEMSNKTIYSSLSDFKYRFFTGDDLASFLCGAKALIKKYGSLETAFLLHDDASQVDYAFAASGFVQSLKKHTPTNLGPIWKQNLFPDPLKGSAAKRVFLYLRWMVRSDAVDPGPWKKANPAKLIVPLDTHMSAACRRVGFLNRKSTDLQAAREATATFRAFAPNDPVRYDFCMTRPGIRPDLEPDNCFKAFDSE